MKLPRLFPLEMKIMEILWADGALSAREVQERFPERGRPAYTTVQTTIYRLEEKKVLRRSRKVGNANIFEAVIGREVVEGRFLDDLLAVFGGRIQPLMMRLIDSGKLTVADVREAEQYLKQTADREVKK